MSEAIKQAPIKGALLIEGRSVETSLGGKIKCAKVDGTDEIYIEFVTVTGHVTPLRLSKNAANCLLCLLLESRGVFQ